MEQPIRKIICGVDPKNGFAFGPRCEGLEGRGLRAGVALQRQGGGALGDADLTGEID